MEVGELETGPVGVLGEKTRNFYGPVKGKPLETGTSPRRRRSLQNGGVETYRRGRYGELESRLSWKDFRKTLVSVLSGIGWDSE